METNLVKQTNSIMEYNTSDVLRQVAAIQELMSKAMKDGEHFGKIPGCGDKPTLLKAGAEKINFMFRLSAHYTIQEKELANGHREYQVITDLIHIPTGASYGQGVGSASTMESKWRFRNKTTDTGEPIPPDYKQNKNAYKEKGFKAIKDDTTGNWKWIKTEKIEHDNPADNYNTVLKMAKKRSLVDASLTSTAASDIFTQDVEELVENGVIEPKFESKSEKIQDAEIVSEKPNKSDFEAAKEELKNHDWNGKTYKGGIIYINNKKFTLTESEIDELKKIQDKAA